LREVAGYLPFDTFRVLDSGLITTTWRGETRLSGPEDLQYFAEIAFRETRAADGPAIEVHELEVRGEVIRTLGPPPPAGSGPEAAPQRARSTERLLASSLSLRPGETVVAGTSRLDDDRRGLVVLLTALAP
jgi:hypothetical protein